MAGKVFINYRRGDDPGTTGRLFDRLEMALGRDCLFMDVEGHIKAGDDYVDVLRDQVAHCDVVLAIIGPRWLAAADAEGRRRLDFADDWVRVEIASALETGKRVIPVYIGATEIVRPEDLPDALKPLARRQAARITLERFNADVQGLVSQLEALLAELEAARVARTEAERKAAEETERRRADEDARAAEAQRLVEARGRQQAAAGLSAEEIRKAEELANWDFIKSRASVAQVRDHLARFPAGVTARFATAALDDLVWASLSAAPNIDLVKAYLGEFPNGARAAEAKDRLAKAEADAAAVRLAEERRRKETESWAAASAGDAEAVNAFLRAWPGGDHAAAAKTRLKELKGAPTRRWLLQGAGAAGALSLLGFVPGFPLWRRLIDGSRLTLRHADSVGVAAFGPDGRQVVTTSGFGKVHLWNSETGTEIAVLKGHQDLVYSAVFSPDGMRLVTVSKDAMRLWNVATGQGIVLKEFQHWTGYEGKFSPDGKLVGAQSIFNSIEHLWDSETGQKIAAPSANQDGKNIISFNADGKYAVTWLNDTTTRLWNGATWLEIAGDKGNDRHSRAWFSPDGKRVLTASIDGVARVWDSETGRETAVLSRQKGMAFKAVFSPNSDRILIWSEGNGLSLWNGSTGTQLAVLHVGGKVSTGIFSPDGNRILLEISDTLHLLDGTNGKEISVIKDYGGRTFVFSPDSKMILTAGYRWMARLWDGQTGQAIATLKGHWRNLVSDAAFSPDGRRVVTASHDGTAKIWDIPAK